MSELKPVAPWKVEDIDVVLSFLPAFEEPGFKAAVWPALETRIIEGVSTTPWPHPDYHPTVNAFLDALASGFIDPYAPLPEDPVQEPVPFSVLGTRYPLEYFATATLNQLRRYFMLCKRGERFCDGHIEGEFASGSIVAALKRLKELRDAMR